MKQKKETVLSILGELRDLFKSLLPQLAVIKPFENQRFIRKADGTVTDKQLNLIWYPTLAKKMTWEEAKKECQKIGCRLPTRQELESLLDLNKNNPAIDTDFFPDTKTDDWYWTSDTVAGCPGHAWYVVFDCGSVSHWSKDINFYVRPVRSSQ